MNYWFARLLRLVAVLLAVTFTAYLFVDLLPGDTVDAVLGPNASIEDREAARDDLRLDDPVVLRYGGWLADAVTGDLGISYRTHEKVTDAIRDRLPVTIELVILSQLLAFAIAVPMAVFGAMQPGSILDKLLSASQLAMLAIPGFLLALALMAAFAVRLGWFPTTGWVPLGDSVPENLRSLTLPAFALGIESVPMYARVLRTDLLHTFDQDFIWHARAKGASTRRIVLRHALRPASIGTVTLGGITVGRMIGGAVLVEQICALPGLGRYTIDAINNRDFLALQGAIVVATVGFVAINFLVDIAHGMIDPRIRTLEHAR